MSCFENVKIKIIVGKNSAADRCDTDRFASDTQIVYALGYEPVDQAVPAAGTVPHWDRLKTLWFFEYFFHQKYS